MEEETGSFVFHSIFLGGWGGGGGGVVILCSRIFLDRLID